MIRFIKALIRTLIEFVVILIAAMFALGLVKYISASAVFIILLSVCFLLNLYFNYKDSK